MTTRYSVRAAGVVYALAGACGLVFGTFPADLVLNLVHLGLGAWGVMAYASRPAARSYSRRLAAAAAGLTMIASAADSAESYAGSRPALSTTSGSLRSPSSWPRTSAGGAVARPPSTSGRSAGLLRRPARTPDRPESRRGVCRCP